MLSRRQFLSLTGGAGALITAGGWTSLVREQIETAAALSRPTRTLVVVQLGGGNDGLNTVVPDDGRYRDVRPRLAIAEAEVIRPARMAGAGLHPALAPVVPRWDAGHLAVVQSLGYAHAGRSHFECSQHWWDGTDPMSPSSTGWLGRWLDATAGDGRDHPLRAIALGAGMPALRAERSIATVVLRPEAFAVRAPRRVDATALTDAFAATAAPVSPDAMIAASQRSVTSALAAVDLLAEPLAGAGARDGLADQLALVGDLIVRRLGTEVITCGVGGFDTHATQAADHAALLGDLAAGLDRLWQAIVAGGVEDHVLVMTTSEFGRRVAENGSLGTDHGLGGCQLMLGTGVRGGMVGDVDLGHLHQGDLHPTIDPRSLYATALDWLGGPTDEVLDGYEDLGILTTTAVP